MIRCLLICDQEVLDARTNLPYRSYTNAWIDLTETAAAMLDAQAQGCTVLGLLTTAQPRTVTGKRVLAVGAMGPQKKGA